MQRLNRGTDYTYWNTQMSENNVPLFLDSVLIYFYVQQFRDTTLEVLSCGHYISHEPSVSINMRINTQGKVLPL